MLLLKITKILKMSNFTSLEKIITEIQSFILQMNAGKLQLEELETLSSLTRDLNERIVILKYKAYEEKVFGTSTKVEMEKQSVPGKEFHQVISEMSDFLSNDLVKQAEPFTEDEIEVTPEIEPSTSSEEPIFGFDLFEENIPESFAPKVKIEKDFLPEEGIANHQELQKVAETLESVEAFEVDEKSISEKQEELTAEFGSEEMEEKIEMEQEVVETVFNQEEEATSISQEDVFKNFQRLDSNSRFMSPKIHSLVGAFGLNEKLQCIRELYNGSSESFNQAIEKVDNQSSFESAKKILAETAISNSWDLESNLVNELLQKVERRFL